nr:hypothetical protein [Paenibacillus xylanexedens]
MQLTDKQRNSLYVKLKKEVSAPLIDVQGKHHGHKWLAAGERFRHASAGTNECIARLQRPKGSDTDLYFNFHPDDVSFEE